MTTDDAESKPAEDEEVRRAAVAALSGGEEGLSKLLEALGDESWRVRKEAVDRASRWPDPNEAAVRMVEALSHPDNVGLRNAAVDGLAMLGALSLDPLIDDLARGPAHRKYHVDTLGLIGDARSVPILVGLLSDPDANVCAAAAEALGRVGGAAAETALREAMSRGDLLLSLASMEALNAQHAVLSIESVAPFVEHPILRPAALVALGGSRDPNAGALLVAALDSHSPSVREAAMRALDHLHVDLDPEAAEEVTLAVRAMPAEAVLNVVSSLSEGVVAVRRSAALILGLLASAHSVEPLARALADDEVQSQALAALAAIGPAAAEVLVATAARADSALKASIFHILPSLADESEAITNLLYSAVNDFDVAVAGEAVRALGALGGADAIAPLMRALERPELSSRAVHALEALGRRFGAELREVIKRRGFEGPSAADLCRVLGSCGRSDDAPLLLDLLHSEAPSLRREAAGALGRVGGGEEVEDALCFALADEAAEVRAQAAGALGNIESDRAVKVLAGASHDEDLAVKMAAIKGLGRQVERFGDESEAGAAARAAVVELVQTGSGAMAVAAIEVLGRIGPAPAAADEMGSLLVTALAHEDAEIVKSALHSLALLDLVGGDRWQAVAGALRRPEWDVRRAAVHAIGMKGDQAGADILRAQLVVEKDSFVRETIVAALRREGR